MRCSFRAFGPAFMLSCSALASVANAQDASSTQPPPTVITTAPSQSVLAAGTPIVVMLNDEISTVTSRVGDIFQVTVLHDVVSEGAVVIPQGTIGHGEVTFVTNKGGFGKPGILAISLRHLEMPGRRVALDGRYRQEGKNNNGVTAATWVAVGIFSGFIQGKAGVIPKGRELKARTGEDIAYAVAPASPPASPPATVQ
jgi:hypothetical protein